MNILLDIGLLLLLGYTAGWLFAKIGLPKVVGYLITGILFSPDTIQLIDYKTVVSMEPLMDVCLAFIVFEVGGALKWSKVKKHEKEIVSITLLASIFPFILIAVGIFIFGFLFPLLLPFSYLTILALALLLGTLASSTAPAATLAVIHQYKARGKVSDTIIGVVALDDALGVFLFSITISIASVFMGAQDEFIWSKLIYSLYSIFGAIILGTCIALVLNFSAKILQVKNEGQWIVIISALIILCLGLSRYLQVEELLSCMTLGLVTVNKNSRQDKIFKIIERYTEEFIFLFFFLLSGLHLNISTIPQATSIILVFVFLRIIGKYIGAYTGARIVKADHSIQKYTAGGLIPQAGIAIGLALNIYHKEGFEEISEIILTTIMGAIIINELLGPVIAKYSLMKAGEIKKK